ncbi:hypothetical_protein [Candidozyma auris]|uniref:hypothetical_protein n=1 Tax=Candidozyma auris TaxID=498019 RepID=UPI000D2E4821|nr:hypothetical_protein [[Candida] auris]QEO20872.1 hypothetical_protein [[Candida] auris]GBL48610.1 hypothetical protein CAJCM15448_08840 [[Candida] auris]
MLKTSVAASPAYMNLQQQYHDSISQGDERSFKSSQSHNNVDSTVKYITFNQDSTCVAIGLNNGYKLYSIKPKFSKCHVLKKDEAVGIVEMLYCTSLLAIVALGDEPGSSPRKLKIVNTKDNSIICDLIFPTAILGVRLSRHRVVVLLEEQIYIYDIISMHLLHTIETSPNTNKLCTLSDDFVDASDPEGSTHSTSFLAYPSPPKTVTHEALIANPTYVAGNTTAPNANVPAPAKTPKRVGDVIIFDLKALQPVVVIEAHKSALAALCLSRDGHLLATASNKGTIVRVFSVDTGEKLYQFRRGTYPTKIYSLSFSSDNKYVVATSSSETVHIFRLGEEELLANKQRRKRESKTKKMRLNPASTINEEDEDSLKKADEEDDFIEDDGDDSDAEGERDSSNTANVGDVTSQRKLSHGSTNSINSGTSTFSNISATTEELKERSEPVVDQSRLSVARLIRRSSQNLGRKAAQKMGDFLPSRFSSILEPTRHFASLKIQTVEKDVKSIATMNGEIHEDLVPLTYLLSKEAESRQQASSPESGTSNKDLVSLELVHINVVTSEGYYYTYGLDPDRGGDCILLNQYSLLED